MPGFHFDKMQHIINEDDTSGFEKYHEEMENFISKSEFAEVDTSFVIHALISVYGLLEDDEMNLAIKYLMEGSQY